MIEIREGKLRVGRPVPVRGGNCRESRRLAHRRAEALRALAALGVVALGNGRRARVGTINNDVLGLVLDHAVHTDQVSIQQIYDVRRTIEMRTVSLAALRRLDVEADTITAHAVGMRDAFFSRDPPK